MLPQGHVKAKEGQSLRVDDGTGEVDVLVGSSSPGVQLDSVAVGSYVLLIGKVLARGSTDPSQWQVKAHKVRRACPPAGRVPSTRQQC